MSSYAATLPPAAPRLGCKVEPREIIDHIELLKTGVEVTFDFADKLSHELVVDACEGDGSDLAAELTTRINDLFCTLANLGVTFRKFFQCVTWYPLYQSIVVDTLCYSATPAFTWLASTQFLILMMILVILTFRVVLWDLDIEDKAVDMLDDSWEEIGVEKTYDEEKEGVFQEKDEAHEAITGIACPQMEEVELQRLDSAEA
jgi:hypothetical protein